MNNDDKYNSSTNKTTYSGDTFFTIPRFITKLPGISITFLNVYEQIFQFWHKDLPCFLSNETLSERAGCSVRQAKEALTFFEKSNHLIREKRGLRRFLLQPQMRIEWKGNSYKESSNSSLDEHEGAPAPCSVIINHEGAGAPRSTIDKQNTEQTLVKRALQRPERGRCSAPEYNEEIEYLNNNAARDKLVNNSPESKEPRFFDEKFITENNFFSQGEIRAILAAKAKSGDKRTDKELISQVQFHVENRDNTRFKRVQSLQAAIGWIKTGSFETPAAYVDKEKKENEKKQQEKLTRAREEAQDRQFFNPEPKSREAPLRTQMPEEIRISLGLIKKRLYKKIH